jgi:hypothetical protein
MADEETMLTSPGPPDYILSKTVMIKALKEILPCGSPCETFNPKSAKGWEISHHMENLERVISITWLVVRML